MKYIKTILKASLVSTIAIFFGVSTASAHFADTIQQTQLSTTGVSASTTPVVNTENDNNMMEDGTNGEMNNTDNKSENDNNMMEDGTNGEMNNTDNKPENEVSNTKRVDNGTTGGALLLKEREAEIRNKVEAQREKISEIRDSMRKRAEAEHEKIGQRMDGVKSRVEAERTKIGERRDNIKNRAEKIKENSDNFKNKVEAERAKISERKDNIKNKVEDVRAKIKTRRIEHSKKISDKRIERISAYAQRMSDRLHAIVNRIDKLEQRISSRIEKFSNAGINTTSAEAFLTKSKEYIASANTKIDTTKQAIITAIKSSDPKTAFKSIRPEIEDTINTIRESHKSIVDSVQALIVSFGDKNTTATTTDQSNNKTNEATDTSTTN